MYVVSLMYAGSLTVCLSEGSVAESGRDQGRYSVLFDALSLTVKQNDDSIPMRSSKKTGAKSKKDVREKVIQFHAETCVCSKVH